EHKDLLDRIAKALLERESLESDDLDALVAGQPLPFDARAPATLSQGTRVARSASRPDTSTPPRGSTAGGPANEPPFSDSVRAS
ncbi:MAG TPA: hypothetical protein VEP50_04490, partial [bacterium]|nr:hypothetical protein [bacterium]